MLDRSLLASILGASLLAACANHLQVVAPEVVRAQAAQPPTPSPRIMVESTTIPTLLPPSPTWSRIFDQYFALGTEGSCGRAGKCHGAPMAAPASAYAWLRQRGYIDGERSAIASGANSCLRWFGGNMPPTQKTGRNDQGMLDLRAWVGAGAADN